MGTVAIYGQFYRFKRGDTVTNVAGRYRGTTWLVDSPVFRRTEDYPGEYGPAYHVVLDDGTVVIVRVEQVVGLS